VLKRAFTLIELLIVVAIIAILAAIAVPNFLEAQTRAKVSRSKADMRSYATAIEAYRIDNNYYPTYHYTQYTYGGSVIGEFFVGGPGNNSSPSTEANPYPGPNGITTPISYITSLMSDVFHIVEGDDPHDTMDFLYVNWEYAADEPMIVGFQNDAALQALINRYGVWRLISAGPDKSRVSGFGIEYDATNGTISLGDIYRTQRSPEGDVSPP